ncbi:rod-binding protein [Hydrogenimonas sp.]
MRYSNINQYQVVKPNIPKPGTKDSRARLKEQTDAFEAIMVKTLLDQSMKSDGSLLPKDPGRDIYRSMMNDERSRQLSGNFGYSELLFNFLMEKKT